MKPKREQASDVCLFEGQIDYDLSEVPYIFFCFGS